MYRGGDKMSSKVGAYELADILGCKPVTIYAWLKKGLPYTVKMQGMREIKQFDIDEVKKWIKDQRRKEK